MLNYAVEYVIFLTWFSCIVSLYLCPTGSDPSPVANPTTSPVATPVPTGELMSGTASTTRYWDCSGGACGCAYIPIDYNEGDEIPVSHCYSNALFRAPDDNEYGAKFYGTAAISAALGGDWWMFPKCGRCFKVTGQGWDGESTTLVLRAANFCPPGNAPCENGNAHFDIAAPGFDYDGASLSNTCSRLESAEADGFGSCGRWMIDSPDPAQNCDCDLFNNDVLKAGCNNFRSLKWNNPEVVYEELESCPDEMVTECSYPYPPKQTMPETCASPGPTAARTPSPTPSPTPTPTTAPTPSPAPEPTTLAPTRVPTPVPTDATPSPTASPTTAPTPSPALEPTTLAPTRVPTPVPKDATPSPTTPVPTPVPTPSPTSSPTPAPTGSPTHEPTLAPAPIPTPVPTLTPVAPVPGQPANLQCTYEFVRNYNIAEFEARVVLTNTGSSTVKGWSATVMYNDGSNLIGGWYGVFTGQGSSEFSATNLDWNKDIDAGATVSFHFKANKGVEGIASPVEPAVSCSDLTPPPPPPNMIQCTYELIENQDPNSFQAKVTMKNTGTWTVEGWNVIVTFIDGSTHRNGWNGIFKSLNADYSKFSVTNLSWNEDIHPGSEISFNFIGNKNGSSVPVEPGLTGVTCQTDIFSERLRFLRRRK